MAHINFNIIFVVEFEVKIIIIIIIIIITHFRAVSYIYIT
jgi:hypothetical protein